MHASARPKLMWCRSRKGESDHSSNDWFLFPNLCKVKFLAGTMIGYQDGRVFGMDEYGRRPPHPRFENEEQRQFDFKRFEQSRKQWAKRRFGKPVSHLVNQMQ